MSIGPRYGQRAYFVVIMHAVRLNARRETRTLIKTPPELE
jgi:hypothetical protein